MLEEDKPFKEFLLEDGRRMRFTKTQWDAYIQRLDDAILDYAVDHHRAEQMKPSAMPPSSPRDRPRNQAHQKPC